MSNTATFRTRNRSGSRHFPTIPSLLLAAFSAVAIAACSFGGGASAPHITQQPKDRGGFLSGTASFSVGVEGKAPLVFQWLRDGTAIAGATDVVYTTPAIKASDDGAKFSVAISNEKGTVTSAEAKLTVFPPPTITTQPAGQTVNVGATATFTVTGAGESLVYQWYRNDIAISGATSASYTTAATVAGDDGAIFTVDVINGSGRVTSDNATLTVLGSVALVTPPVSQSVNVGQPAIFSVVATGGNLTYQWRRNGSDIAGATGAIYTTPAAAAGDDGASFDVVVTNASGSATSSPAVLTVVSLASLAPPALPAQLITSKSNNPAISFSMVRKQDGTIVSWGDNSGGQAGNGTTSVGSETPKTATLPAGLLAVEIAAGAGHILARLDNGDVYAWGANSAGQLGLSDSTDRLTPTAVTLPGKAKSIAAGALHSVAVLEDGTVWAWGSNVLGELGTGNRSSLAVAVPTQVQGLPDPLVNPAVEVAAGNDHTLVRLDDGTVMAWGANGAGQLGNGQFKLSRVPVATGLQDVARIRAGGDMSMAITNHRVLLAWGEDSDSQLGRGAAITTDVPTPTGVFADAVDVAASNRLLLIVASDGRVLGAGANESGSLGDTTTTARNVFTQAAGLANILTVASGGKSFSLALQSDGSVFAWGDNTAKQLGNTAIASAGTATPTLVPSFDAIP
jgi:alpha-tubulin suppressor-like RCC1 family protein